VATGTINENLHVYSRASKRNAVFKNTRLQRRYQTFFNFQTSLVAMHTLKYNAYKKKRGTFLQRCSRNS